MSTDTQARELFATELSRNFSLVAPAGTGKTTSITRRVVSLALRPDAVEILPRLLVVTYTNKAADELAARCRTAVHNAGCSSDVEEALRQAQFSTIHGLCLGLIRRYGHHIGCAIDPSFDPGSNDEAVYLQWESQAKWPPVGVSDFHWSIVRDCFSRQIFRNAVTSCPLVAIAQQPPPEPPLLEIDRDLARAVLENKRSRNGADSLARLTAWVEDWNLGDPSPPPRMNCQAEDFSTLYGAVVAQADAWLASVLGHVARCAAQDFSQWRISGGKLFYDDQVRVARRLLAHPLAARMIKLHPPIVILDEAQDTDPMQFSVLLALAAEGEEVPEDARDIKLRPGAFCMVGDPQQSIYSERARPEEYYEAERLILQSGGERLNLETTYRCSQRLVDFVNKICSRTLDGREGQAMYARFSPAGHAPAGRVVFLRTAAREKPGRPSDEADRRAVALWLASQRPKDLGARSWDQVAVLLPTRSAVAEMEAALQASGLPVCNLTPDASAADSPELSWLLALCHVMVFPDDEFEIVGILREIFGLSDTEIAAHRSARKNSFRLADWVSDFGVGTRVEKALRELAKLALSREVRHPRQAVELFEEHLSLRARLEAVCLGRFDTTYYQTLRLLASSLEAKGATLAEFREVLQKLCEQHRNAPPPLPGHIQLLTCHAAKGLEWDCVLLPHFFGMHLQTMNSVVWEPRSGSVWPESAIPLTRKESLRAAGRREFVRLAYVALTRARHTLLIHDNLRSVKEDLTPAYKSFGHLLKEGLLTYAISADADCVLIPDAHPAAEAQVDAGRRQWFLATHPGNEPVQGQQSGSFSTLTPSLPVDIFSALRRARTIPRRILPHETSPEPEDIVDSRTLLNGFSVTPDNSDETKEPALGQQALYGLWWHKLMEHLPWVAPPEQWRACFERHIMKCPDPARGNREWQIFVNSEVPRLVRKDIAPRVEECFFRRLRPDGDLVEGVIDWMLLSPDTSMWTIIDWKTNMIRADAVDDLIERYRTQLELYKEAVERLTGYPATALLYSTVTGLVLRTC